MQKDILIGHLQDGDYLRASVIYFCASAEAWIQEFIVDGISKKSKPSDFETEWYKFLVNGEYLSGSRGLNTKLIKLMGEVIGIRFQKDYKDVVKEYEKLAEVRNSLLHYSVAFEHDIYKNGIVEKYAYDANKIIVNLINKICEVANLPPQPFYSKHTKRHNK